MQHTIAKPLPFHSVFERHFDVVVVGSGFVGFAAARTLAAKGATVALLEPSGDLLWEAVRALESGTGVSGTEAASEWESWLQPMRELDAVRDGYFDPTHAEILAAREILEHGERWVSLLNAMPVVATVQQGRIEALTVSVKGGLRSVRGSHWVDATEKGTLAALCQVEGRTRTPRQCYYNLVLQSSHWETAEPDALSALLAAHPDVSWHRSPRPGERRLRIPATQVWWQGIPDWVRSLREYFPETRFMVSQLGLREYPVYPEGDGYAAQSQNAIENLWVASPAHTHQPLYTAGDRFMAGVAVAQAAWGEEGVIGTEQRELSASTPLAQRSADEEILCDVLVAGSGTAGTVAAIAAARRGGQVCAIDQAPFPGGVGTGGGIVSYYGGFSGGIQEEIDRLTIEMSTLLSGDDPYWEKVGGRVWHYDAKKLVINELFARAGVDYAANTQLFEVERDESGTVHAAWVVRDGRIVRYRARTFIDSTGDGDLCVLAGAQYVQGRPGDSRSLSYSQVAFAMAEKEGWWRINMMNFDSGWVDATDPEDLTQARLVGLVQQLHADWSFSARPYMLAPLLGIRQSRNIVTDVSLGMQDLIRRTRFVDTLGLAAAHADSHSVDYEFESDEMFFYLLVCRCFNYPLYTDLPYRMLLPKGLRNVWVACRAAGIDSDAAYCVRMQRDMQRLGEAAGIAAAHCASEQADSRKMDLDILQQGLKSTGALVERDDSLLEQASKHGVNELEESALAEDREALLQRLDSGKSGIHLWHLYHLQEARDAVAERLDAKDALVSFYAASVLAMQGDNRAEPRLLQAIENREEGIACGDDVNKGPFSQVIDIPFWLQATALLRVCGTVCCIDALNELAQQAWPFNVSTLIALTCERLASRVADPAPLLTIQRELLNRLDEKQAQLPTTRSLYKTLHGVQTDAKVYTWGVDTTQDHLWQLHLILARTERQLGKPLNEEAHRYLKDPRAYVRKAFAGLGD